MTVGETANTNVQQGKLYTDHSRHEIKHGIPV